MESFGIIILSHIPVRLQNNHRSEMVTQALFGELFLIIESETEWTKIQLLNDEYTGYIQENQWMKIENFNENKFYFNSNKNLKATFNNITFNLPIGATIWKNNTSHPLLSQFKFSKKADYKKKTNFTSIHKIIKTTYKFLRAPYLWGGKTTAGIDCSGLVQTVFQVNGLQLPRDAYQQAEIGKTIILKECKPGDLAFFTQGSEKISHVGIIYEVKKNHVKIIHSSAFVKIDSLDEKGIFYINQQDEIIYSHQLKLIKRVVLS